MAYVAGVPIRSAGTCSTSYSVDPSSAPHYRCVTTSMSSGCRCHAFRHAHGHLTSLATNYTLARLVLGRSRPLLYSGRPRQRIHCSKNDSRSSNSRRPRQGWPPWDWLQRLPSLPRLLFNVLAFCLLLRLWPLRGTNPLGDAQVVNVQVPFSTFVQQTNGHQVSAVTVDGTKLKYTLREDADLMQHLPDGAQPASIAFQTTRPADYAMPYDKLLKHGIQFGAVEARHNWMLSVMVSLMLMPVCPCSGPCVQTDC